MTNRMMALVLTVVASGAWMHAHAEELEERVEIAHHVSALFEAEEFDELDRMAEEFRTQESRTSSGLWKLTPFYGGLYVKHEGPVDESYYDHVEELFLKWAEQNPASTVAHVGYASTLMNHAWFFRGTGWARDVPKEAWEPFYEYVSKARLYLSEHKQAAAKDPVWYQDMLVVAKAESWPLDRFTALVEEATARHPYFYEIYFTAIAYLLPKWHGDKAMVEGFANAAVKRTEERDGVGIYARIYWYASQAQYGTSLFTDSDIVWEKMSAGIDDVLARYPDQWNINNFAHFACLARDKEKAKTLLALIVGPPIESAWARDVINYRMCRLWVKR